METTNFMPVSRTRSTRTVLATALAAVLLGAGCAPMTESECRVANWQALGERDGLAGLRPQVEVYAHQCSALKIEVPESTYMTGWTHGKWEYDSRVHRSDCCGPN